MIQGTTDKTEVLIEQDMFGFHWRYEMDAPTLENGEEVINEIKTVGGFSFKMHKEKLDTLSHLYQVSVYMALQNAKRGRLIYINRDPVGDKIGDLWFAYDVYMVNPDTLAFKVVKSDYANGSKVFGYDYYLPMDALVKKHTMVKNAVAEGKILPREFQFHGKKFKGELNSKFTSGGRTYKTDWQCRYCDWKTKCWRLNEFMDSNEEYLAEFLQNNPEEC